MNNCKFYFILLFLFSGILISNAQDSARFKDQIEKLSNKEYNFSQDKKLVVFAGGSSIRMWQDVQEYFPDYNVINNGFGGSHFSDLIYFYDKLIAKYNPDFIFIYEGDNDIAGDKKPSKIKREAKKLAKMIQKDLPQTKVVFISPKPSIARKHLKLEYEKLNRKLSRYCNRKSYLEFADVWNNMLDSDGNVYEDIFIEDGLHMNKKGYDLWAEIIADYL